MRRVLVGWIGTSLLVSGCARRTCAGSDDRGCRTPSPCEGLAFSCPDGRAEAHVLTPGESRPPGLDALASPGDIILSNDQVVAVIDALDHPHYVAPTGGNLIDLAPRDGADSLTHVFHAVGLLPGDSVAYERLAVITDVPGVAAVEVHGHLAGQPLMPVVTRYEVRPCEPGIRVRTEVAHRGADPATWALVDAWYWSGREALPFAPGRGTGFEQPGLGDDVAASWRPQPFFAASSHSAPATAYGELRCDGPMFGLHTEQLSVAGPQPRVVQPGDMEVFERFVVVAPGGDIASATEPLLMAREMLFDEPTVRLRGRLNVVGDSSEILGTAARATLRIDEGSAGMARSARTPWTQVTPHADGTWEALVPAHREYVLTVDAWGREEAQRNLTVQGASVEVPPIAVVASGNLTLRVTVDGTPDHALVFVSPGDEATRARASGMLLGGFVECAPLLGSPTGGSPACDRILVDGEAAVRLPPGRWDLLATAGPFATLAHGSIEVASGDSSFVELALQTLEVHGDDMLSADFHVHGAASFDSTLPDLDRVQAFLAARMDVIAATDHDVAWDYADARRALGSDARVHVMVGVEATGHVLFDLVPGAELPQVIGHWNIWPIDFDAEGPYRGAPWDELAEPGLLITRFADRGWSPTTGVVQLNHPWAPSQFGRDLGFPRALGIRPDTPIPRTDRGEVDASAAGLLLRTPPGARFGNGDYHTQEVMNGTENEELLAYRAYWFALLNQGIIRAGTGNSDSHSLVDSVLGTPRTLVRSSERVGSLDEARFNRAVREGRMLGTNGPAIEASLRDRTGALRTPSTLPFAPAARAELSLRITAAPWVPVDEVRIVVNGEVVRTLADELRRPTDPLSTDGVLRFEGTLALAELGVTDTADAWIVVEAGERLPLAGDLDCDGYPDTTDNDGDGRVDARDVDWNGDGRVDASDTPRDESCGPDATVGPLARTPRGPREGRRWFFAGVTPHGYAFAFTNPLLLDWDGDGFDGPGLEGAR